MCAISTNRGGGQQSLKPALWYRITYPLKYSMTSPYIQYRRRKSSVFRGNYSAPICELSVCCSTFWCGFFASCEAWNQCSPLEDAFEYSQRIMSLFAHGREVSSDEPKGSGSLDGSEAA